MLNNKNPINLLFLSAGRRVNLIKHFKNIFQSWEYIGSVIAADINPTAPAIYYSDKSYLVPKLSSPDFIKELIKICRIEKVTAIIPLIDPDLMTLDNYRGEIESIGSKVIASNSEVLKICNDKNKTNQFFNNISVLTPKVLTLKEAVVDINQGKSLFIKPMDGSSSKNAFKINSLNELNFLKDYVPNPIIQEYIEGVEYTIDVFSDFEGKAISIVPRIRLETRNGESSKGKIVLDTELIDLSRYVVETLGLIGPSTLQGIKDKDDNFYFIEINPRFGGGVLFSIKAGANSPEYLVKLLNNEPLSPKIGEYNSNLYIMRFDDELCVEDKQLIGAYCKND